nr:MAG TPA: hypothetical protein [Caudoviricetes sp.]
MEKCMENRAIPCLCLWHKGGWWRRRKMILG